MKYRILSSRVEVRGIGTFTRGDVIDLDPATAAAISGPGGALLEPVEPPKKATTKEAS